MRQLKIIEHISLDGVIQAPGSPDEDGDFLYGGWAAPFDDPDGEATILAVHENNFDLLLGRHTYDIWSGFFPQVESSSFADSYNHATKYVATHRPESLEWGPSESVGTDLVEGVRRIKAQDGPTLITWGSSTLTPLLIEHGLADEVWLLVYPVLLGTGKRLFSGETLPRELTLVSASAGSSGIVISHYRPYGPLRTGSYGVNDGVVEVVSEGR